MTQTYDPTLKTPPEESPPEDHSLPAFLQRIGFTPDPLQQQILDSPGHRVILNCCRQWGKSTITAVKAVHRAVTVPGSLTIVASPSERQSGEFLRKARDFLLRLDIATRGDGTNHLSLLLPNGSRMIGIPGLDRTTRGFSAVSLLIIDEASRTPDSVYRALRPMLAVSSGDLWVLSTPYGRRGFFYETWSFGPEWSHFEASANLCPRISTSFLEEERRSLGDAAFRQEYLCEFIDAGPGLFALTAIEACLDPGLKPLALSAR